MYNDSSYICFNKYGWFVVGKGFNCGPRVRPYPGQFAIPTTLTNLLCCLMEELAAAVVAQALPGPQHITERCRGKCFGSWVLFNKGGIKRYYPPHLSLLEHHLRD